MPRLRLEDAIHSAFVELTALGEQYLSDFAGRLSPGLRRGAVQPLLRLHSTGPERVSELAEQLGLDSTTVTRHLDELESRGLVVRRPDPTDRRAVLVHLTPKAVAQLDAADADRRTRLGNVLADWTAVDRHEFARLLNRFVHRPQLASEIAVGAGGGRG
jgi:DNA-binding MarR family transcriptional regulator